MQIESVAKIHILVLEDDARLGSVTASMLDEIASHMKGAEVVLLFFVSFGPCVFSSQDAFELAHHDGRLLINDGSVKTAGFVKVRQFLSNGMRAGRAIHRPDGARVPAQAFANGAQQPWSGIPQRG